MTTLAAKLRQKWPTGTSPLERQRLARGLTRQQLGQRAGLATSVVQRAEETGNVTDRSWWALADALNVQRDAIDPAFRQNLAARGVLHGIHEDA